MRELVPVCPNSTETFQITAPRSRPRLSSCLVVTKSFLLTAYVISAAVPLTAQQPTCTGILRYVTGDNAAGSTLILESPQRRTTAVVKHDGMFTLTPGDYAVAVRLKEAIAKSAAVLHLACGAILQISAGTVTLDQAAKPQESTGGEQLSGKAVSSLPLNNRDFSHLLLLAAGTKGKRFSLPNSRIMIHQPSMQGLAGQAADIDIYAKEILRMREILNKILSDASGQTLERVARDVDRDYIMSSEQAVDYGIVDRVISSRELSPVPVSKPA